MHRPTLLLTGLSSPPTSRRSSILRRSSLVTTEIGLALCNPGILQNYDLFVSSLLSFSGEDEELSTPSASRFSGLTQASDAEACSFYKIGLNILLQEFLVHHNLPNKLEPLIREVVKWNHKYLSLKTQPPSNLSPAAWLFILDKGPLSSTPPPGTKLNSGGGFALLPRKSLEEETTTSALAVDQRIIFYQPSLSPNISTLNLLSLNNTSKSPTVLVTIHGPLGNIKVLALLDTGTDANFIEEKLAKLLGLPAFGSLDVKVGNSTLIGTTPILQPVTIDLEGSPFRVMCNSSPNLSFPFILGFLWLRESLLNFDHPNNKISFTCHDVVKLLSLVPGTLG
ncbi:hypothetical protein DSO57_1037624 [Entomophthora muscae]|uniref:Uncharacterized protein n=1 Tax=Entomophthora muscae TaxID=34485 RepID=A0ACC2SC32_9FUNG|nr:hypothetical protein DSO57_1037624 [Entomophthora muscae]